MKKEHENNSSQEIENQIEKDIRRTFLHLDYFKNDINLGNLRKLLNLIANSNKELGYVQGMNFIAAFLLIKNKYSTKNLARSFVTFDKLLNDHKYGISGLFSKDFPKLYLTIYQIDKLCIKYIPEIHKHFIKYDIKGIHWLSSCVLTLFLTNIRLIGIDGYNIFFDLFYKNGWDILVKFLISLLMLNKDKILENKQSSEILIFLLNDIWKTDFYDVKNLAMKLNIDQEIIELETNYVINKTKSFGESPEQLGKLFKSKITKKYIAVGTSIAVSTLMTITGTLLFFRFKNKNNDKN